MDDRYFFSATASSFFDTYLIYGIVGLLISIAMIGLIVLLATSCCCCYSSTTACCLSCYHRHQRRHLSYKLRSKNRDKQKSEANDKSKSAFVRRHPSDVADFSQLYESCPHLINSKAMTTKTTPTGANMETSCTTIDTIVSPISPCSSFRSFVGPGNKVIETKPIPPGQTDLNSVLQQIPIATEKPNNSAAAPAKGGNSRPFSYIKNTNDRAQILRRFTSQDRSAQRPSSVPIEIRRTPSSESDSERQNTSNCTNIYETVVSATNSTATTAPISTAPPPPPPPPPIYETEWTHSLRELIMETSSPREESGVSIIELPSAPPDLVPSNQTTSNYFQQKHPHDKFLANRSTQSDSMRRANMLRRLKDDAAFLY